MAKKRESRPWDFGRGAIYSCKRSQTEEWRSGRRGVRGEWRKEGMKERRMKRLPVQAERWKPEERGETDDQEALKATSEQSLALVSSLAR